MKQQETVKIPIHSVIDLITNSSTEIFVNSRGSLAPCKELIDEILKLQGLDKTCDDLFNVKVEMSRSDIESRLEYQTSYEDDYMQEIGISRKDSWQIKQKKLKKFIDEVLSGQREQPDWWEEILEGDIQWFLVIEAKDPQHEKLAELLRVFLYSGEYYEHCD